MRSLLLVMLLVSAPLAGCLEQAPSPNGSNGADGDEPGGASTPDGPAGTGTDQGGRIPSHLFVHAGLVEDQIYLGQPAFDPLAEDLQDTWQQITDPNGTPASLEALASGDETVILVGLRLNGTLQNGTDVPQPPEANGTVHTVVAIVRGPNGTLDGHVVLCWGEMVCRAYPTSASMASLANKAELLGPDLIRYQVNGTALRDQFREHGWVHIRVPVHGVLNITGEEDEDVFAEDACVSRRGKNNTTQRTCGDELRQQQAFIDGYATRWTPSENNSAHLTLSENGIYGSLKTPTQQIELHPAEQANGSFLQEARAEPGSPSVRLFVTVHGEPGPANVTVRLDGTKVLNASVERSPPGTPGASTMFFAWNATNANLTVERDGESLNGTRNLTLEPVSFVYIRLTDGGYSAVVDDHRHIEG